MIEFTRKEYKDDPVMSKMFDLAKKNHVVANHTKEVLMKNAFIDNFCEEARHFVQLKNSKKTTPWIHYDISSWLQNDHVLVRIDSIGVYDNVDEYLRSRAKLFGSNTSSEILN